MGLLKIHTGSLPHRCHLRRVPHDSMEQQLPIGSIPRLHLPSGEAKPLCGSGPVNPGPATSMPQHLQIQCAVMLTVNELTLV